MIQGEGKQRSRLLWPFPFPCINRTEAIKSIRLQATRPRPGATALTRIRCGPSLFSSATLFVSPMIAVTEPILHAVAVRTKGVATKIVTREEEGERRKVHTIKIEPVGHQRIKDA